MNGAPPAPAAIEIRGLVKRYGDFTAVDGVSLRVEAGEFFGFLGPNGAGKTTTINAIVGLAKIGAGTISVLGYDNATQWREARRLVGLSPQEFNFDRYLSIRDVLIYAAGYFASGKDGQAWPLTATVVVLVALNVLARMGRARARRR